MFIRQCNALHLPWKVTLFWPATLVPPAASLHAMNHHAADLNSVSICLSIPLI